MATVASHAVADRSLNRAHRVYFSVAITCISRFLTTRDLLLGWSKQGRRPAGINERSSRQAISARASKLDAVYVEPMKGTARAAVLICHGIGETVEQWFGVQQLLAAHGVASLVFDYSGYGKSRGRVDWDQFELDTMAAFTALETLAPRVPHSVLGFSLGSGIAAATINKLRADRLILCQAFTSFRNAATSGWVPKKLEPFVPPIWHAQKSLALCKLPVLVVHGENDRLFPVSMAADLAGWCSPAAEMVLVPGTVHNQAFRKPHLSYWGPIIDWLSK